MSFNFSTFIQLVRWKNLLIIAITLMLLRFLVSTNYSLSAIAYFSLIIGTICIAAAGNIINDILDYEIDKINNPAALIIQKKMSKNTAYFLYFLLNIFALVIAFFFIQNTLVYYFFFSAIFLLFLYSKFLKKMPILGNFTIALLCAWIVVQFWWLEIDNINPKWQQILAYYTLFAFWTTWTRELIKDLEDIEGDRLGNCKTMPIVWGEKTSIFIAKTLLGILIFILLKEAYFFYTKNSFLPIIYIGIVLVFPLFIFYYQLEQTPYSKLSKWLKYYILLGLVLLFFV